MVFAVSEFFSLGSLLLLGEKIKAPIPGGSRGRGGRNVGRRKMDQGNSAILPMAGPGFGRRDPISEAGEGLDEMPFPEEQQCLQRVAA